MPSYGIREPFVSFHDGNTLPTPLTTSQDNIRLFAAARGELK